MKVSKDDLLEVPSRKPGRPKKVKPIETKESAKVINSETFQVDLNRALYRKSFYHFHIAAFPNVKGDTYDDNWHVKALCDDIQVDLERSALGLPRIKHVDVNISPRTGKSFILNVSAPLWFHILKPNAEILTIANGDKLAAKMLNFTKKVIKSAWFRIHYPEFELAVDNESMYEFKLGGRRQAFGIKSNSLGENADLTICDDLLDTDTANSDTERTGVIEKLMGTIFGRFNNKNTGLFININQRLHINDVSGAIQDRLGEYFRVIKLPSEAKSPDEVSPREWFAQYTEEVGNPGVYLMWDAVGRLSREDLRLEKARLGTLGYAQQHLQKPRSTEGGIIKSKWLTDGLISPSEWDAISQNQLVQYQLFLDGAETTNPKNDATSWIVTAKLNNQLYIVDAQWRRLELPELQRALTQYLVLAAHSVQPISRVYIEGKSIGKSLLALLRQEQQLNNIVFKELQPGQAGKGARAVDISAWVEGGRVHLVKGSWCEDFIDEVSSFTGKSGKKHDDALDALIYAVRDARTSDFWCEPV